MKYKLRHKTTYRYTEPVVLGHNQVVSEPRPTPRQTSSNNWLEIEPQPQFQQRRRDHYGNWVTYFTMEAPHEELVLLMRSEVAVEPAPDPSALPQLGWESVSEQTTLEAARFMYASPRVPINEELRAFAQPFFPPGGSLVEGALRLTEFIHREFRYSPGCTDVSTPVHTVLQKRKGVCQDFAHLQLGAFRSLGLAARYVSGYLLTLPPPGQPRLVGADASHAWVSLFMPGTGWLDLDPTNNKVCSDQHIVAAWGRDYNDVAPVRGLVLGGGKMSVHVSVDVQPLT